MASLSRDNKWNKYIVLLIKENQVYVQEREKQFDFRMKLKREDNIEPKKI